MIYWWSIGPRWSLVNCLIDIYATVIRSITAGCARASWQSWGTWGDRLHNKVRREVCQVIRKANYCTTCQESDFWLKEYYKVLLPYAKLRLAHIILFQWIKRPDELHKDTRVQWKTETYLWDGQRLGADCLRAIISEVYAYALKHPVGNYVVCNYWNNGPFIPMSRNINSIPYSFTNKTTSVGQFTMSKSKYAKFYKFSKFGCPLACISC